MPFFASLFDGKKKIQCTTIQACRNKKEFYFAFFLEIKD